MNKKTKSSQQEVQKFNSIPVIVLLLLNLLGVGAILGMLQSAKSKSAENDAGSMVEKQLHVDRLGNINLQRGRVTFDLLTFSEDGSANVRQNVSLPQEGFLHGYSQLEQFMSQMIEKGFVGRSGDAEGSLTPGGGLTPGDE